MGIAVERRGRRPPTVLVEGHHYVIDPATGCWEWQLAKFRGYGQANGGKAHRVMWTQSGRPLEPGIPLHHLCRNKGCINPDHLELIDLSAHMRMHRRERSEMTLEQATEIKRLCVAERDLSMEAIGIRSGATREQVKRIAAGLDWAYELGGPLVYSAICPWCGESFVTLRRNRRFCTAAHRSKFNARETHKRRLSNVGQ